MEEPVPVGSMMMLTVDTTPFYGRVCYCNCRDEGYYIGLEFSDDTTWSAGVVEPKHLTNMDRLGE